MMTKYWGVLILLRVIIQQMLQTMTTPALILKADMIVMVI